MIELRVNIGVSDFDPMAMLPFVEAAAPPSDCQKTFPTIAELVILNDPSSHGHWVRRAQIDHVFLVYTRHGAVPRVRQTPPGSRSQGAVAVCQSAVGWTLASHNSWIKCRRRSGR